MYIVNNCNQEKFWQLLRDNIQSSYIEDILEAWFKADVLSLGFKVLNFNTYCKKNGLGTFLSCSFNGNREIQSLGEQVFRFIHEKVYLSRSESENTIGYINLVA